VKIAVVGLWHLGMVTAAGLAAEGHDVVALDDAQVVAAVEAGRLPVDEPGLAELIAGERASGRLRFASDASDARGAALVWICYDTPVDDDDRPDVDSVLDRTTRFLNAFEGEAVVVVSSQLPAGSVAELERRFPGPRLCFAAIPENLRLGSALAYFRSPDRFIAGVRDERAREAIGEAIGGFANTIVWMSVESAEVTKHAINAFLATSVTFANELASVCERVGADAREVERGLKSDVRVGPKAYVRAGEAFAGGTLARDLAFLAALGDREQLALEQLRATAASNERHRDWVFAQIARTIGAAARRIAILGLVYKPGTDTLRASTAVALARKLHAAGAEVAAYDPAVAAGDARLAPFARVAASAADALNGADCAVVATPWPEFRALPLIAFEAMRTPLVIDPARFLEEPLAQARGLRYVAFGRAQTVEASS
jgi:UDPglucose 6-dehydrogenase